MKALVLEAYNKLVYRDVTDPVVGADDVLIEVRACGICGSDVHGLDGSTGRRIPPLIMGHEASGIIIRTGDNVRVWKAGDRVTFDSTVYRIDDWYSRRGHYNISEGREVLGVSPGTYRRNGAFAELISVPQHILYAIPANVTYEQAAMVEAAAVALHAINISAFRPGDSCSVTGAGTIGINLIKLLRISGASVIIAVDTEEGPLLKAGKAGADFTFTANNHDLSGKVRQLTSGRGTDIVFEASGNNEPFSSAVQMVRRGGRIVLIGNTAPDVTFPLQKIVTGEISVFGSCAICGEYETILDFMGSGKLKVDDLISAVAPLSEGAVWFEKLYSRTGDPGKVILCP